MGLVDTEVDASAILSKQGIFELECSLRIVQLLILTIMKILVNETKMKEF